MASGRNPAYRATVGAFLVAAAVALMVVTPSLARPAQNLNAKVKALATGLSEFSGRVTATNSDCIKGRQVKISTRQQLLGKTKTDKDGRFFLQRKSVKSGTEVTFDLKERGEACIPLTATLKAP